MKASLGACLLSVFGLLMDALTPEGGMAYAAPAIRVLLASDVQRVEARASHVLWVTDEQGSARVYRRARVRIERRGQMLFLDGIRIDSEQLTLRAGHQELTIWLSQGGEA